VSAWAELVSKADKEELELLERALMEIQNEEGRKLGRAIVEEFFPEVREELLRPVCRERAHLLALLACHYPALIVEGGDDTGWPILYMSLGPGLLDASQVSWHISSDDIELFDHVSRGRAVWDGHTTEAKYGRIEAEISRLMAEFTG
jgi:hypothetical protein